MTFDPSYPLLQGRDAALIQLREQARRSAQNADPVLIVGPVWMGAYAWAKACTSGSLQHYELKSSEGLLGESHLWSHLRALMDARFPTLYLTGFSGLDPVLQASLLDWLQNQNKSQKMILQLESEPVAALQSLSFYRRSLILKLIPLDKRPGDIPEIVQALVAFYNRYYSQEMPVPDAGLLARWQRDPWPGDLNELDCRVRQRVLGRRQTSS